MRWAVASDAELLQRTVDEVGANAERELIRAHAAAAAREERITRTREDLARRARSEAIDKAVLRQEARNLRDDLAEAKIVATPLCDLIDIREDKEDWRKAVESVLGNAREAMILQNADQYIDPVRVQRRSTRSDGVESVTDDQEVLRLARAGAGTVFPENLGRRIGAGRSGLLVCGFSQDNAAHIVTTIRAELHPQLMGLVGI